MNRRFLAALLLICIVVSILGGLPALLGLIFVGFVLWAGLWALTVILKGFFPQAYREMEPESPQSQAQPVIIINEPQTMPHKICPNCNQGMETMPGIPGYYCWGCGRSEILGAGNGKP